MLALLVLGACGKDASVAGTGGTATTRQQSISDQPLIGTDWTVIGFVDGAAPEFVDAPGETPAAVGFEENRFVSGNDGCNGFGHVVDETATDAEQAELGLVYEVEENRITFAGSPLSTLRGCPGENYESYGRAVMAVLRGTVTYEVDGHQLTLRTADGRGVMYTADA